ncbi:putative protein phosphatase 2C 38 [Apium graveolens]|uniref:putative protein phosphatase 2C 38 n=1 Tax=Apium graveolens TaxID=4045 RepID=UPI003D7B7615
MRNAIFVGVYDGHGGSAASRYVPDHLFDDLMTLVLESEKMSADKLKQTFLITEAGLLSIVDEKSKDGLIIALTHVHDANVEEAREELKLAHPSDPKVVFRDKNTIWRFKGIIQNIAKRLIERALGFRPSWNIGGGARRGLHDDITVVVIFLDHEWPRKKDVDATSLLGPLITYDDFFIGLLTFWPSNYIP